ncbi:MAG: acyclic terpene utilization AtuA family protein [Candidatus Microthrix subdominans]
MRSTDPDRGYATTVVRQMEDCLGLAMDAGVKIVVNAGGLNPAGLADRLRELSKRLGVTAENAHVEGDRLLGRADELGYGSPLAANAYLGAFGIATALNAGPDVGDRTGDRCLVGGPARHSPFGRWIDDLDALGQTWRASAPPRSATATTTWSTGRRRSPPPGCASYATAAVRTGGAGAHLISLLVIDTDTDGADLDAEHATAVGGGGPKYVERHRSRGKLPVRERIELLLDEDSPFLEQSALAAWVSDYAVGASVVTGIGVVSGVEAMISASASASASDPTVRGGASNPWILKKVLRANEIALTNRLPMIGLAGPPLMKTATGSDVDEFKASTGRRWSPADAQLHGYPVGILAKARGVPFSEEHKGRPVHSAGQPDGLQGRGEGADGRSRRARARSAGPRRDHRRRPSRADQGVVGGRWSGDARRGRSGVAGRRGRARLGRVSRR